MNPNNNNRTGLNKESVAWFAADKFYDIIQELHMDMLECRKQRDIWGMIDTLHDFYILVFPYIEKHMSKEDKNQLENFDDVNKCLDGYKADLTDFAALNSSDSIRNAIQVVNGKRLILSKLMAKAQLNIPLKLIQDDRPAAFGTDDW